MIALGCTLMGWAASLIVLELRHRRQMEAAERRAQAIENLNAQLCQEAEIRRSARVFGIYPVAPRGEWS